MPMIVDQEEEKEKEKEKGEGRCVRGVSQMVDQVDCHGGDRLPI